MTNEIRITHDEALRDGLIFYMDDRGEKIAPRDKKDNPRDANVVARPIGISERTYFEVMLGFNYLGDRVVKKTHKQRPIDSWFKIFVIEPWPVRLTVKRPKDERGLAWEVYGVVNGLEPVVHRNPLSISQRDALFITLGAEADTYWHCEPVIYNVVAHLKMQAREELPQGVTCDLDAVNAAVNPTLADVYASFGIPHRNS